MGEDRTFRMPCCITVSRETGKVTGIETGQVREEEFRRICQALIRAGLESMKRDNGQAWDSRQGVRTI